MPEKRHHAHHLDFSLDHDWLASYTTEIVAYCRKYPVWYAFKHELGDNNKLHLHLVLVDEILTKLGNADTDGSMTASNKKAHLIRRCPTIQRMLAEHGSRYSICSHPCHSDYFIEYMQKEGQLQYYNLPKDIVELKPYFADLLSNKPKSSDYENWDAKYKTDQRPDPATFESVWNFFGEHMFDVRKYNGDIKVLSDPKKLRERVESMVHYINGTVPALPQSKQSGKRPLADDDPWKIILDNAERYPVPGSP